MKSTLALSCMSNCIYSSPSILNVVYILRDHSWKWLCLVVSMNNRIGEVIIYCQDVVDLAYIATQAYILVYLILL